MRRLTARTSCALASGCIALALAGCAIDPVTNRPSVVLTSEAGEIEQGREAAEVVREQLGLVESPRLSAYVNAIGQRLARHAPRRNLEHHFFVVDMAPPNAFTLPGGYVYVSRGLLSLLNSEDELASVIGHEIGHTAARHSVEQQARTVPFLPVRIVTRLGGAAAGIVAPRLGRVVAALGELPGALLLASYSRDQEREADRLGQKFATAAGWDPAALGTFMNTLSREETQSGHDPDRTSFFASHPSSPERSAESFAFAKTLPRVAADPVARSHAEFLRKLEGIVVGARAAEGLFIESRFLQPELGFALEFPEGWETRNGRDFVAARSPDEKAFAILRIAGKGDDALEAAQLFAKKRGLTGEPEAFRLGTLTAARGISERSRFLDGASGQFTWVAHGGLVYLIAGVSPAAVFDANEPLFDATGRSFHPLTREERTEIRENRLRVRQARQGESLEQLLERTGSVWTPEEAALANGIEVDAALRGEMPIKLAIPEPYAAP